MRIAGYVRHLPSVDDGSPSEPGFAQWERIRRWVDERGELMVAVCQDDAAPRAGDPVAGMRALLALLDAGAADTVVISSVSVLGDPADQELALWELRRRGGVVFSTDPSDRAALDGEDETGERKSMRRLLDAAESRRRLLDG
jgi:Resolvase, N terminal domain